MKTKLILPMIGLGLAITSAPVFAHHAFAAEYDVKQTITLKGSLTGVDWVNPHAWLHIDVKDDSGKVVNWSVEFGSPNALLRKGLRKTDFPPGTEVVIDGYRAKDGTATINGRSVKLPDGRNLFTGGSSPDEQPQR
jgi:uncharacterized protein DUF6152